MPHSASAFSTSWNAICDARYQNECWYTIARSKFFCASGLHDVSKCTVPSFLSSTCAKAGRASATPAAAMAVMATDVLIMVQLAVSIQISGYLRSLSGRCRDPDYSGITNVSVVTGQRGRMLGAAGASMQTAPGQS